MNNNKLDDVTRMNEGESIEQKVTRLVSAVSGFDIASFADSIDSISFRNCCKMIELAIAEEREALNSKFIYQKHRADALAGTIRALQSIVTHDNETKADFICSVRKILAVDPDERIKAEVSE